MPKTSAVLAISDRLAKLDWSVLRESLCEDGYALTSPLLTQAECQSLIDLYTSGGDFRSHIIMSRYRFGRGDYKYFDIEVAVKAVEIAGFVMQKQGSGARLTLLLTYRQKSRMSLREPWLYS
jgi:hypothetical protein